MSTIHDVRCNVRWAERLRTFEKTCEVRFNDRDYQTGDTLVVVPVNDAGECVADPMDFRITHVLSASEFPDGLKPGWCVLSLEPLS